jgi:pyruvate ferredoxin oxidoreductase alpha subunit
MDRAISFGLGGPLYHEIRSAVNGQANRVMNFIYGLGGRDLSLDEMKEVFRTLKRAGKSGKPEAEVSYIGLRE